MCEFFSFLRNKQGKFFYLNAEQRQDAKKHFSGRNNPDSHSFIVEYFQKKNLLAIGNDTESKFDKFEYNPLTKKLVVDYKTHDFDFEKVQNWCDNLNFKNIVPELIIKPVVNPLIDINFTSEINEKHIKLLKKWDSVSVLVWDSVSVLVWDSVRYSVSDSVRYSVRYSVSDSVWDSVRYSVSDSVRYSVRYSVWESVRDLVWGYISSFFKIEKWKCFDGHEKWENPFQSCIDLWEMGLVPSFDGKTWRLHSGPKAKISFEISKEELQNYKFKDIN